MNCLATSKRQLGEHELSREETLPVSTIVMRVAAVLGLNPLEISQPGRRSEVTNARSIISYIGYKKMGYSGEVIAKVLGITRSGVCRRAVFGEKIFCQDARFQKIIEG